MKLAKKDFHFPLSNTSRDRLTAFLLRGLSEQAAAASVVAASGSVARMTPVPQDMDIMDVWFLSGRPAASTETMTIDIQVQRAASGSLATILSAPYVFSNTSVAGQQVSFANLLLPASKHLFAGDLVSVVRTLANGSTIVSNAVGIDAALAANNPGDK